ncbi:MAG: hypothetical protein ACFB16_14395 [Phormidesmis sp.]
MTLQQLYSLLADYKPVILLAMLLAPWLALGICIAVPGKKEEPFVLSFNLLMATLSLLLTAGYVWYATHTAGVDRIVQEADLLLILAPFYYVGVSLWVTKQRIPLSQIPLVRAIQGLALIAAGYMGLVWLLSKLRIVLFSFLPLPFLVLLLLGLLAVGYMGYQRITGEDLPASASRRPGTSPPRTPETSIDDELEALRRDLED